MSCLSSPLITPDKNRFCQEEIKHTPCRFFFFFKFFFFLKQNQPHRQIHPATRDQKSRPKDGFCWIYNCRLGSISTEEQPCKLSTFCYSHLCYPNSSYHRSLYLCQCNIPKLFYQPHTYQTPYLSQYPNS